MNILMKIIYHYTNYLLILYILSISKSSNILPYTIFIKFVKDFLVTGKSKMINIILILIFLY